MATESSTAAPKVIPSPLISGLFPPPKITKLRTIVSPKRAPMAIVFILPRFLMPISNQRIISAPIIMHHTQFPISKIPFTARAPSKIMMAVQPTS